MTCNPNIHHLRSIRLKGYHYSQAGLYFITICVQDRVCLFGNVGAPLVGVQNNHDSQNDDHPNNVIAQNNCSQNDDHPNNVIAQNNIDI